MWEVGPRFPQTSHVGQVNERVAVRAVVAGSLDVPLTGRGDDDDDEDDDTVGGRPLSRSPDRPGAAELEEEEEESPPLAMVEASSWFCWGGEDVGTCGEEEDAARTAVFRGISLPWPFALDLVSVCRRI